MTTLSIKYNVPMSKDTQYIHPISMKGSFKGSNSEVNNFFYVHLNDPVPFPTHQNELTSLSTERDELTKSNAMVLYLGNLEQEQPESSLLEIPPHGKDDMMDEDEHISIMGEGEN